MNPEWVYHFLIGYDQNLAPALVVFCVNTHNDCVAILPYARLWQDPNQPIKEDDPPIRSASLGSLKQINVRTKSEARWVWDSLCNDSKFQMKPTEFKDVYPNYKYSTKMHMSSWPFVLRYNKSDRIYSDTNYALEA